jgi:hypothetical protein
MIRSAFVSFASIAVALAISGCARTTSDAKPTLHATNNTPAQNKKIARYLIRTEYSQWDSEHQFQCLDKLWQAESHWNHRARNKRTGACGIIAWGLQYVDKRYGAPCAAWKRFQRGGGY